MSASQNMSPAIHDSRQHQFQTCAELFSALADTTRLGLFNELLDGRARSISRLSEGVGLTRQAVTKHLRVLESAGLVHSERRGRSILFVADRRPFETIQEYLDFVEVQWDAALLRLKSYAEGAGG